MTKRRVLFKFLTNYYMEGENFESLRTYQKLLNNKLLNPYDKFRRKKEKAGQYLNFLGKTNEKTS